MSTHTLREYKSLFLSINLDKLYIMSSRQLDVNTKQFVLLLIVESATNDWNSCHSSPDKAAAVDLHVGLDNIVNSSKSSQRFWKECPVL